MNESETRNATTRQISPETVKWTELSLRENQTRTFPVRISMTTDRYEVAASLFSSVYGSDSGDGTDLSIQEMSSEEELQFGIMEDPDSQSGYFVKPVDKTVLRALATGGKSDAVEHVELFSVGSMTVETAKDRTAEIVSIGYDETELTGMEGSRTTLTFRTDDKGLITMIRAGTVRTAMTFRAHNRAICSYDTPYMPLSVGIHALTVDNRILEEGILCLDYIIEIRGARAERSHMVFTVTAENSATES